MPEKKPMHLRNSVSLPGVFSSISDKYLGTLEMNIELGSFWFDYPSKNVQLCEVYILPHY